MLSIAYITSRKNPRIHWFIDSLLNQAKGTQFKLIVVDSLESEREKPLVHDEVVDCLCGPPKPNVWNGPFRLTKQDWFAAANARNTALCFAPDGYIVYADDLSVLMPGWMQSVREAMAGGYCVFGTYRKVRKLVVDKGAVVSFDQSWKGGQDSRARFAHGNLHDCDGGWLYGCSCGFPVEALLSINGWDETCDGTGSEDSCTGLRLFNSGAKLKYDKRMLTLESEEAHFEDKPLRKEDWHFQGGIPVIGGNGSNDKSHSLLNNAKASKVCPNYFPPGGIRAVREKVLKEGYSGFPIDQNPQHDWYTGMALKDL